MALNAKQQAYLDSLADADDAGAADGADDDGEPDVIEWGGAHYQRVEKKEDPAGPKVVKRKPKAGAAAAPPAKTRRFLT